MLRSSNDFMRWFRDDLDHKAQLDTIFEFVPKARPGRCCSFHYLEEGPVANCIQARVVVRNRDAMSKFRAALISGTLNLHAAHWKGSDRKTVFGMVCDVKGEIVALISYNNEVVIHVDFKKSMQALLIVT